LIQQNHNNECQKSRLIAIFLPHRYSRVKQFTKEFAEELSKADVIYVTSIYGAGEENEDKITSKIITDLIYKKNKNVSYINNYYEITKNFDTISLGIGAGQHCDGQVLVIDDLLGLFGNFTPKFVKKYSDLESIIDKSVKQFSKDVKGRKFPTKKYSY